MFHSVLGHRFPDIEATPGDEGGFEVVVQLAESDDERAVFVVSALSPYIEGEDEAWDFCFEIAVDSLDGTREPFRTQDSAVARPFIPKDTRSMVMPIVAESLKTLVQKTAPALVYLVTKGASLPEKAKPKYYMLISALYEIGYEMVRDGTDVGGRSFWFLKRI